MSRRLATRSPGVDPPTQRAGGWPYLLRVVPSRRNVRDAGGVGSDDTSDDTSETAVRHVPSRALRTRAPQPRLHPRRLRYQAIPASDPTTVGQGDSAITGRFVGSVCGRTHMPRI